MSDIAPNMTSSGRFPVPVNRSVVKSNLTAWRCENLSTHALNASIEQTHFFVDLQHVILQQYIQRNKGSAVAEIDGRPWPQ